MTAVPQCTTGVTAASTQRIVVRDDIGPGAWNAFVAAQPTGTVEHLWEWREIFATVFGHRTAYLAATRGQDVIGVLPLAFVPSRLFGRSAVSLPFANYAGMLAADADAKTALIAQARQAATAFGAPRIEIRNIERQFPEFPCHEHKVGARLKLPQTPELLWSRIDKKVRNQIRKAQKEGLTVESGGSELLDSFYAVFARNMRDLGTPVFPRTLFSAVLTGLQSSTRVFVVRRAHTPVAASIALSWRDSMLVPWASSLREFRHLCPNMLLYWHMLEAAVLQKLSVFDFGRSTRDGGTHRFKEQWGAESFPLHWEFVMLHGGEPREHGASNPRLGFLISAWQQLPLGVANWIGPHVIRHLT